MTVEWLRSRVLEAAQRLVPVHERWLNVLFWMRGVYADNGETRWALSDGMPTLDWMGGDSSLAHSDG